MLEDNSFSKYIWTKQTCHTNIISKKKKTFIKHTIRIQLLLMEHFWDY
jgi:hypothetical protein